MYQGSNPSALRSRDEIVRAFMALLQDMSLDDITVKQLMTATDLSRQTFYQIFESKEEILEYYLDTVFERFMADFKQQTVDSLCDAAKLFFAFFEDYKETLGLIIRNGQSCVVQRKCRAYLEKESYIHYSLPGVASADEYAYATTFVISGLVAMMELWIRRGSQAALDTHELAELVCRITGTDDE